MMMNVTYIRLAARHHVLVFSHLTKDQQQTVDLLNKRNKREQMKTNKEAGNYKFNKPKTNRAGLSQSAALFQLPSPPLLSPLFLPLSFLSLLLLPPTPPRLPSPPFFFLLFPSPPPPPRRESALLKPDKRGPGRSPGRRRILLHCMLANASSGCNINISVCAVI